MRKYIKSSIWWLMNKRSSIKLSSWKAGDGLVSIPCPHTSTEDRGLLFHFPGRSSRNEISSIFSECWCHRVINETGPYNQWAAQNQDRLLYFSFTMGFLLRMSVKQTNKQNFQTPGFSSMQKAERSASACLPSYSFLSAGKWVNQRSQGRFSMGILSLVPY